MKQLGTALNVLGLGCLLSAGVACGGNAADGTRIGGETNWLLSCNTDQDCTVGHCLCNVCTVECLNAADSYSCNAGPPGSSCATGSALEQRCADELQGGICVLPPEAGTGSGAAGSPTAGSSSLLDALLETLAADLEAQPAADQPFLRYLTVANLREGAVGEALPLDEDDSASEAISRSLARGRLAITKLANSLSSQVAWTSIPIPVDTEQLLQRIDVRWYGWDRNMAIDGVSYADGWEAIVAHSSLAIEYQGPAADRLRALSGTAVPWLFADDFVAAAAAGETYYALLDVPDTLADLREWLQREESSSPVAGEALYVPPGPYLAGFADSGVSYSPRAIERRTFGDEPRRGYWLAFDFESEIRGDAVFSSPLSFVPDATEVIFALPNGLNGYFIADESGRRVADSPLSPATLTDPAQPDGLMRNAASCFSCHNSGMIAFTDQVHGLWDSLQVPSAQADPSAVLAAYPDEWVLRRLMNADNEGLAQALERAGVSRQTPDPISRVFLETQAPVGPLRAAGQLLVTPALLRERLSSLPESIQSLSVDAGRVARREFVAAYRDALCVLQQASANRPGGCP